MTFARTTTFTCLTLVLLPAATTLAFDWGSGFNAGNFARSAARHAVNRAFDRLENGGHVPALPHHGHQRSICVQPQPVHKPVARQETKQEKAARLFASAQKSFGRRDYASALKAMDEVVKLQPENLDVRQFRSLVLFAQQDYQRAAADAYDALLLGPTWTWPTVAKLYKSDADVYTAHYRALSRAAKSDQHSLEKHFLLAYHHLMLGHLEHGQRELEHVLAIQPEEPVTQQLLQVVKNLRQEEAAKIAGTH
jgi:predicted Zn-dependent protease